MLRVSYSISNKQTRLLYHFLVSIVALCFTSELCAALIAQLRHRAALNTKQAQGLRFSPRLSDFVAMSFDSPAHYQLNDPDSAEEYEKLLPPSGHVIHLPNPDDPSAHPQSHTVMLFHQLKCLGIMRAEYAAQRDTPSALTQHCINYIRQTILCRPNLMAVAAWNSEGTSFRRQDAVCNDWTQLYEEAGRNDATYKALWNPDTSAES